MLAQRLAVAAVGIPIVLLVVWVGGPTFHVVVAGVLALTAVEFYHAARKEWRTPVALAAGLGAAALAIAATEGIDWLVYAMAAASLASLSLLVLTSDTEDGAADWGGFLSAVVYAGFLGAHFILLRDEGGGRDLVLLVLLGTYATDSFAYFVGKTVGRRAFAPRISPSKTWEGTAAAVVGGFATVIVLNALLDAGLSTLEVIPLALLFPVFAIAGDLAESVIKRSLKVKDTSSLIPGHGGLVDRLDSLLFTNALVYYWLIWVVE